MTEWGIGVQPERGSLTVWQPKQGSGLGAPLALLCLMTLGLSACANAPALTTYDLSSLTQVRRMPGLTLQLSIGEPSASGLLDGDRIPIRTASGPVAYLPAVQWSERLPRLIQSSLIQSFELAHPRQAVARIGDRMVADVSLKGEIRHFEIDESSREAVVELSMQILREPDGRVIAGQIFAARLPLASLESGPAMAGLDEAFKQVAQKILIWVGREVHQ